MGSANIKKKIKQNYLNEKKKVKVDDKNHPI